VLSCNFCILQARASWYQHIMARLASADYATVQYDTQPCGPFVQTMDFEQEVNCMLGGACA
jgi:hypothetical protein